MSEAPTDPTAEPSTAEPSLEPPSHAEPHRRSAESRRAVAEGDRIDAIVADFGRCFAGRARDHEPPWLARELTVGQIRLLVRLHSTGPQTMGQVADLLGVTVASATGAIERIERHGLVVRAHGTADRRIVECRLTPAGEQVTAEISGVRANAWRRLLGAFDDAELDEFARLVHVLADRTTGDSTTAPAAESTR